MTFPNPVAHVPGPHTAVVADGVALIVEADPAGSLVAWCRTALAEGRGVDGVLDALASGTASPLSFALAAVEGTALRLVLGGRGRAEFAGGVVATLTTAGASGWLDRRLGGSPDLRLSFDDPAQPIDPSWPALPIEVGTVLAIALIVPAVVGEAGPEPTVALPPAEEPGPTQGVLRLATGEAVPVDRDVLLGRAPFSIGDVDGPGAVDSRGQSRGHSRGPRIVTLASPNSDVSRTHIRVGIDGRHVQVTDLGSTNGTVVTVPGRQGVRLRAHDPFVLVPGTLITLADETTIRFELAT